MVLLKIISAHRCDEQERPAVGVEGSDIQKRSGDKGASAANVGRYVPNQKEKLFMIRRERGEKKERKNESPRLCCVFTNKNEERCGLLL